MYIFAFLDAYFSALEYNQRPLNYAIVDEVDSILIDEARTPLIISGQGENPSDKIQRVFLLKLKDSGSLLKGRESWKEFDACPVIGGTDHDSTADAYGGD